MRIGSIGLVAQMLVLMLAAVMFAQDPPGSEDPPEGGEVLTMDVTTHEQRGLFAELEDLFRRTVESDGPLPPNVPAIVRYSDCQAYYSAATSAADSLYDERELATFRRVMIDSMTKTNGTIAGITVPERGVFGQYIASATEKAAMNAQKSIVENSVKPQWAAIEAALEELWLARTDATNAMFYAQNLNKSASEGEICAALENLDDKLAVYQAELQSFSAKLVAFRAVAMPVPAAINPLITLMIAINNALDDLHNYYLNRGYLDKPGQPWR